MLRQETQRTAMNKMSRAQRRHLFEWSPHPPPRPRLVARALSCGVQDDACPSALESRRLLVFERIAGGSLRAARAHLRNSPQALASLSRVETAIRVVPVRIGAKRVREQLSSFGAAALDHLEVDALIRREAIERDRLFDLVLLAATDTRFEDFVSWLKFVDKVKIGRRSPENINYPQAKDIMRTCVEPLAAAVAANAWPGSKIGLGNDMKNAQDLKKVKVGGAARRVSSSSTLGRRALNGRSRSLSRSRSRSRGRKKTHKKTSFYSTRRARQAVHKANRKKGSTTGGPSKSFDLTVDSGGGHRQGHVEVTTATQVTHPKNLHTAILHGVEKARALKGGFRRAAREVSVVVEWWSGTRSLGHGRFIKYYGDGRYGIYQETKNASQGARLLYKRDIVKDDLPHYLVRHRMANQYLDAVYVISHDGESAYRLRPKRGWHAEDLGNAAVTHRVRERRLRRRARRRSLVRGRRHNPRAMSGGKMAYFSGVQTTAETPDRVSIQRQKSMLSNAPRSQHQGPIQNVGHISPSEQAMHAPAQHGPSKSWAERLRGVVRKINGESKDG